MLVCCLLFLCACVCALYTYRYDEPTDRLVEGRWGGAAHGTFTARRQQQPPAPAATAYDDGRLKKPRQQIPKE